MAYQKQVKNVFNKNSYQIGNRTLFTPGAGGRANQTKMYQAGYKQDKTFYGSHPHHPTREVLHKSYMIGDLLYILYSMTEHAK